MPEQDRVYVLDDGTKKAKYLKQYLKEEGYNPKVVTVNSKDNLVTWFENINPDDGYKVFLQFTNPDLNKDNERLRQEIQGLESRGFRNLIVLPFEGMKDSTIDQRVADDVTVKGDSPVSGEFREPIGQNLTLQEGETNNKDNTPKGTKRKVSYV